MLRSEVNYSEGPKAHDLLCNDQVEVTTDKSSGNIIINFSNQGSPNPLMAFIDIEKSVSISSIYLKITIQH